MSGVNKRIASLAAVLCVGMALSACQTAEKPAPVIETFPVVPMPKAQPVTTRPVKWKVYNGEQLEALVTELKQSGRKDFVIFALTPDGYKNLSYNLVEIERYIKEQKRITVFLKETLDSRSAPAAAQTPPVAQ